jgi:hypothetical protein
MNFHLVGERILGEVKFPKNPKPGFEAGERNRGLSPKDLTERSRKKADVSSTS